ncbi:MAG: hypothetical protein SGILL_006930, partial [Bacillariaceae sp.]
RHPEATSAAPVISMCHLIGILTSLLLRAALVESFSITSSISKQSSRLHTLELHAALRTNVEIPLLDLLNSEKSDANGNDNIPSVLIPLPSSNFPDQLATPFLYGLQIETPLHKLILEEATSMALTAAVTGSGSSMQSNSRKHPLEPDPEIARALEAVETTDDSEVDVDAEQAPPQPNALDGAPPNTVLCRGGYRFVVKEVVKTIPFPVVIVDEIADDADVDDSDMFFSVGNGNNDADMSMEDDEDEDEDDDEDDLLHLSTPELIQQTMRGVQSVISSRLDDAVAKNNLSPLEKSILEDSDLGGAAMGGISPAVIELAHAEEMAAVWEVFQLCLIDDIDPHDRRFAVAIMAAELADVSNAVRKQILLTRNSEERLRIVLRELNEIDGMAKAKKIASTITDKTDELDKDLKIGKPQLPRWALQITKGTKIEYFWNEEYGWCGGVVVEEPVTVVDEILLTIRFDEDGEIHKLPLMADEKVRWRPG